MIYTQISDIPLDHYRAIVADPPWRYDSVNSGGSMTSGAANKYDTMSLEDLKHLPVPAMAHPKGCILFLWATTPLLPEAFELMDAWGFTYKTCLFWHKTGRTGLGYWFRGFIEPALIGIRGQIKAFHLRHGNTFQSKVRDHSRKPDEFWMWVEPCLKKYDLAPKLELFAREQRVNWDHFGNEVEPTLQQKLAVVSE